MSSPAQPRHARAEIRAFAKWLRSEGWVYESQDSSGHTLWSHPKAHGQFKLPETPSHFSVRRARREALALLGQRQEGKRNGKPRPPSTAPRRDFALQQISREAQERGQAEARSREQRHAAAEAHRITEARRIRLAQEAAVRERSRRFYEDLMQPG